MLKFTAFVERKNPRTGLLQRLLCFEMPKGHPDHGKKYAVADVTAYLSCN